MAIVFDGVVANNLDMGANRNFLRNVAGGTIMAYVTINSIGVTRSLISISIGTGTATRTKMSVLAAGTVEIRARALDAQVASDAFNTVATLVAGQRYHLAAVLNYSTRSALIYIDGDLSIAGSFATMTPGNTSDTAAQTGTIGANETGSSAPWNGQVEDARVYGRALGPAEIKTIATGRGADGITGSLQGRWSCNEKATGQTAVQVADLSGNGYALTAGGTLLYGAGTIIDRHRRRAAIGRR
jgi:6,7-dimethyl-8-ribityllumazine synthase